MRAALVWLAVALSGCAPSVRPAAPVSKVPSARSGFTARLDQQADGTWTVDYGFDHARAALVFDSDGRARATYWASRTPGATIVNLHGIDALLLDPPRADAEFAISTSLPGPSKTLPFVHFSDGSMAIHLGQLTVLTVASRADAEALGGSLATWHGEQPTVDVAVTARAPMLLPDGQRAHGLAHIPVRGGTGYLYVGTIAPVQTEDFVAVIDPGLPGWLALRVQADLARIYAAYRARWRDRAPRAVLLLAFGGADDPHGTYENQGFSGGAQLTMSIRGSAYASENPDALRDLLWFFAHEAAHQFQFRGGRALEPGSDWITEGAANAMATAALHDLGLMDKGVMERRYWQAHRQCSQALESGPLEGQGGRASLSCGDLIAEMTAACLPDHDLFAFWNALRDLAARDDRGQLTAARYFALLRARGAPSAVVDAIQSLVTTRLADPRRSLGDAMQASGLEPVFAADGGLSTMWFPAVSTTR